MEKQKKFIKHYEEGFMPWAHENPDFNLVEIIKSWPVKPCKTLEVACGTGVETIWLTSQGFQATGIDVSPVAIDLAKQNASKKGIDADFRVFDFMTESLPECEYDFVFDRGFFHGFHSHEERVEIVNSFHHILKPDGLWLSLLGSADGEKQEIGPPLKTATEIISAIEPMFEVLILKSSYFGNEKDNPSKNWVLLMKKRVLIP